MNQIKSLLKLIVGHPILSVLLGVIFVAALSFFRFLSNRTDGSLTAPIDKGAIVESVYGIGTVMANKSFRIMPGLVNTITHVWVKEGDSVKKGDPLISNENVKWTAPFGGTVTSFPFRIGENVFSSVPVLTLVDLLDRYVLVSLEQQGALRVERGQKVRLSFDSIREQSYSGRVVAVYSNDTGYLARIDIGDLPAKILPNMTADVAIEIRHHEDALLIPVSALEQGKYVWRKREYEIPTQVEIKLGIVDRALAEVLSGDLRVGDRLLIRRHQSP